ncbi:MAG: rRNA maturation RNase YbeY [Chlorobi bacterium]|jgi:probable rRNA maturation factor|nr:rRNA maturation RNase YbeY [Chlorobiota bacterium]
MNLDITVINAHPRTRLRREAIGASVERVLTAGKVRSATVNVILVDDDELLRMNREHLKHDYYTDVITFLLEEKPLEGEIYISVDRAREQAAEYKVGLYEEIKRLAIHGTLHLLGHDDATGPQREAMSRLEERFLGS